MSQCGSDKFMFTFSMNLCRFVREKRRAIDSKYRVLQVSTNGCNLESARQQSALFVSCILFGKLKGGRLFGNL